MPMQPRRKWHSLEGRSVKRQIGIVTVAAILSIAGVGLLLGLWWLISLLVDAYVPHLVHTRAQSNFSVLTIMLIMIAFLGGWLTSVLPRERRLHLAKPRHTRPHPHLHLRFRH